MAGCFNLRKAVTPTSVPNASSNPGMVAIWLRRRAFARSSDCHVIVFLVRLSVFSAFCSATRHSASRNPFHSYLSASIGLTRAALRAGR